MARNVHILEMTKSKKTIGGFKMKIKKGWVISGAIALIYIIAIIVNLKK